MSETRAVDTSTGLCQLVKSISKCMDKRNEFGVADLRYLMLSKNLQFWELRYPM